MFAVPHCILGCVELWWALKGLDPRVACRYNPDNRETLEQHAQFQAESSHYDFEANLTLIKL